MKLYLGFLIGLAPLAIVVPFVIFYMMIFYYDYLLQSWPFYFMPILWGLWNVITILALKNAAGISGVVLGIIDAFSLCYIFKITESFNFNMPIIFFMFFIPLIYLIIWHFFIGKLNARLINLEVKNK